MAVSALYDGLHALDGYDAKGAPVIATATSSALPTVQGVAAELLGNPSLAGMLKVGVVLLVTVTGFLTLLLLVLLVVVVSKMLVAASDAEPLNLFGRIGFSKDGLTFDIGTMPEFVGTIEARIESLTSQVQLLESSLEGLTSSVSEGTEEDG